jgi:hypothetical protein
MVKFFKVASANIALALHELPLAGPLGTSAESSASELGLDPRIADLGGLDPRIADLGAASQLIDAGRFSLRFPEAPAEARQRMQKIVAAIGRAHDATRAATMKFISAEVQEESSGREAPRRGVDYVIRPADQEAHWAMSRNLRDAQNHAAQQNSQQMQRIKEMQRNLFWHRNLGLDAIENKVHRTNSDSDRPDHSVSLEAGL